MSGDRPPEGETAVQVAETALIMARHCVDLSGSLARACLYKEELYSYDGCRHVSLHAAAVRANNEARRILNEAARAQDRKDMDGARLALRELETWGWFEDVITELAEIRSDAAPDYDAGDGP